MEGKTQETAAAKAGMSMRSARQVAEWPIAVGDETGTSVAHPVSIFTVIGNCSRLRGRKRFAVEMRYLVAPPQEAEYPADPRKSEQLQSLIRHFQGH